MHSIKTAIVVSVLLVVAYAVYQTLNNERAATSPSDGPEDWPAQVKQDAPEGRSPGPRDPFGPTGRDRGGNGTTAARVPWNPSANTSGGSNGSASTDAKSGSFGSAGTGSSGSRGGNEPGESGRTRSRAGSALTRGGPEPSVRPTDRADVPGGSADALGAAGRAKGIRPEFGTMIETARRMIQEGALVDVLRRLSCLYGNPDYSAEESRQLTELLDQLAGTAIYSRQHHLEPPYVVKAGDTLQQIAQQYQVSWQLLAKINGVRDPDRLAPGRQLKVVRGPFDAIVLLDRYELVLQIDELYAGRFPIGLGRDRPPSEGSFVVRKKMTRPTYRGPNGIVEPGAPDNPLGKFWIGLDEQTGIHGTNDPRNLRRADGRGTICLGDRDIEDVYDILCAESPLCPGSKVTIRRSVAESQAASNRQVGAAEGSPESRLLR